MCDTQKAGKRVELKDKLQFKLLHRGAKVPEPAPTAKVPATVKTAQRFLFVRSFGFKGLLALTQVA